MNNLIKLLLFFTFTLMNLSCYAEDTLKESTDYYQSSNKNTILILKENSSYFKMQPINSLFLADLNWFTDLENKIKKDLPFYHLVSKEITETVSSKALQIVSKSIEEEKPKVIVIALGENDGLFSKTINEIRQYLSAMIKKAQSSNAKVILVGNNLPLYYGLTYTNNFVNMYSELAKKFNLAYVPESKISYTYPLFLYSYNYDPVEYIHYQQLPSKDSSIQNALSPKKASNKIWVEVDKIISKEKENSANLPTFYRYPEFLLSSYY